MKKINVGDTIKLPNKVSATVIDYTDTHYIVKDYYGNERQILKDSNEDLSAELKEFKAFCAEKGITGELGVSKDQNGTIWYRVSKETDREPIDSPDDFKNNYEVSEKAECDKYFEEVLDDMPYEYEDDEFLLVEDECEVYCNTDDIVITEYNVGKGDYDEPDGYEYRRKSEVHLACDLYFKKREE